MSAIAIAIRRQNAVLLARRSPETEAASRRKKESSAMEDGFAIVDAKIARISDKQRQKSIENVRFGPHSAFIRTTYIDTSKTYCHDLYRHVKNTFLRHVAEEIDADLLQSTRRFPFLDGTP
jgi:hypothetical protein